jgi:hypothetical protein
MGQINLAGQIAEARHAGRCPTRYSHLNDNEQTSNYGMEICGSDEEGSAWMNLLFIRARNRLDNFWAAVEALAEELLNRETITGAQAREIILKALAPPMPAGRTQTTF